MSAGKGWKTVINHYGRSIDKGGHSVINRNVKCNAFIRLWH